MKVFLGFLLLASLTIAAVDEKEATPIVPESKKTDLLITANGQTIKVNADGKAGNPIGLAAHRFRQSHHRNARVNTRHMQDDEHCYDDEGEEYTCSSEKVERDEDDEPCFDQDGHEISCSSGKKDPDDDEVEEFEVKTIEKMITELQIRLETPDKNDNIVMPKEKVVEIISMLETFTAVIDDETIDGDEERKRRRRSRVMKRSHHSRRNEGSVRHHRTWARRQSVVHHAHFNAQKFVHGQRIVVNP